MKRYKTDLTLIHELAKLRHLGASRGLKTRVLTLTEELVNTKANAPRVSRFTYAFVHRAFVWLLVLGSGAFAGYMVSKSAPGDMLYPVKFAAFRVMQNVRVAIPVTEVQEVTATPEAHGNSISTTPGNTPAAIGTTEDLHTSAGALEKPTNSPLTLPIIESQESTGFSPRVSPTPISELEFDPSNIEIDVPVPGIPLRIGL